MKETECCEGKTGKNREALVRSAGMSATVSAMGSRTGSAHAGTSQNNQWTSPSLGYGSDNIKTN